MNGECSAAEPLLETCRRAVHLYASDQAQAPIGRVLAQNPSLNILSGLIEKHLNTCLEVFKPAYPPALLPAEGKIFKAVNWNIERGKNFSALAATLEKHPELGDADFYFFTEVDWGMARSENRNVAAELATHLGHYAYYAPSYYNFTNGHGAERTVEGKNTLGLHGNSILSRYPLKNLRVVPLPNLTDKLNSKESRLGQKRALLGDLAVGEKTLTLACAHLDAFSSPRSRARQLAPVAQALAGHPQVLLAGDWNTNTLDSTRVSRLLPFLLYQIVFFRPVNMVRNHHPFPERYFERHLFRMLEKHGFQYENCNERGVGTFDLLFNDHEMGAMARDQYPAWALKYINRLINKAGGNLSMKLDWFAVKGLLCEASKVIPLPRSTEPSPLVRPSDHHPIVLRFQI